MVKSTCHHVFCYGQLSHVIPASTYRLAENAFTASSLNRLVARCTFLAVYPQKSYHLLINFVPTELLIIFLISSWSSTSTGRLQKKLKIDKLTFSLLQQRAMWQSIVIKLAIKFINKQEMRMLTAIKIVHFKEIFKLLYKLSLTA